MKKSNNTSKLPQIAVPQPTPSWLQNFTPPLQQARCFSNNDQDKEALTLALAEHKRQPSLDSLEQAFDSSLVLEQFKQAKALLKEMKKLGASDVFLNLQKATYYMATEKLALAKRYVKQALLHKNQLDNRHRAYLYFTQGILSFIQNKLETLPITQALHYDYLLMPSERGMCYLVRGLIRLDREAYEAAYQDAQSSLHARPQNDVAHYLRAMAGYYSGHLTHLQQDTQIVLQSQDELIGKTMKSTVRQLQNALPKEPVVINKDFMNNLRHRFFDDVDDMIDTTEDLDDCLATWTGPRFENKMGSIILKSMEYLREALSPLNKPDLDEKLKEIQEYLQLCVDKYFTQACLDLIAPSRTDATLEQLHAWRKQILLIMDGYDKVYQALVDKLEELAVVYQIPVFLGKKKKK